MLSTCVIWVRLFQYSTCFSCCLSPCMIAYSQQHRCQGHGSDGSGGATPSTFCCRSGVGSNGSSRRSFRSCHIRILTTLHGEVVYSAWLGRCCCRSGLSWCQARLRALFQIPLRQEVLLFRKSVQHCYHDYPCLCNSLLP